VALPGLGTDNAGDHWANVIMAKDQSADAFAAAVRDTLQRDQRDRIARGRVIADAFDWTRIGGRILDVYNRVVGRTAESSDARQKAVA